MEIEFNLPMRNRLENPGSLLPEKTEFINSKYSVQHVAHFYTITQGLIIDQTINPVGKTDQQHLVSFSKLMVRLIPTSGDYLYDVVGRTYRKGKQMIIDPPGKAKDIPLSEFSKRRLLDWMAGLDLQANLNMEDVLDRYFAVFPFEVKKNIKRGYIHQ